MAIAGVAACVAAFQLLLLAAMAHYKYDRNTKWMVRKHGDSILYFGGVRQVRRWRALQTELVEPNKLPDGLLEVYFQGRNTPDYFLLEIATYPEKRALVQALKDLTSSIIAAIPTSPSSAQSSPRLQRHG